MVRAEVQSDGNFVLYTADKPVWHTDTKGKKNVHLVLQDDRNLVLYSADGAAWSTKTETDAPPPPAPRKPPRHRQPPRSRAPAAAPRAAADATATAARSRATYTVDSGDTLVGHRGAVLRRRQQVPDDR